MAINHAVPARTYQTNGLRVSLQNTVSNTTVSN